MIAEGIINQMIPPLKPTDTGQVALNWMDEFRVTQLPVVENQLYKGIIMEDTILESGNSNNPISEYRLDFKDVFVFTNTHFYDVIKLASKSKLQIVPVVNEEKVFQGVVSVNETSAALAQMFAAQGPGGIVIISIEEKDYSLAQISRLIEANEAKILSLFVNTDETNPSKVKVTIKLNKEELSRVIATLERYEYKVIAQFQDSELINNDKERLDLLFKYLNI